MHVIASASLCNNTDDRRDYGEHSVQHTTLPGRPRCEEIILFNIPRYLDDHAVKRSDGSLTVARVLLGNDATFQLVYAGVVYYVVIYALPVLILAVMTYRHPTFALFFFIPISDCRVARIGVRVLLAFVTVLRVRCLGA